MFLQFFTFVTQVITLAMGGGLIFSVLVQPRRKFNNYVFIVFAAMLSLWALLSIFVHAPADWWDFSGIVLMRLRAAALLAIAISYYLFIISLLKPAGQIVRLLTVLAGVFTLIALILIASGQAVIEPAAAADISTARPTMTTSGLLILGGEIAYLALAFWLILSSAQPQSHQLRIPTGLLILAFVVQSPEPFLFEAVAALLLLTAALWVGWAMLRHQVFNPMNELNNELRIANRDLQQVINDLAAEKSRTEALNADLRAANAYKREFLANMSHELRTPLNSIIGYSELLRQGVYGQLTPKQGDRLEKIYRNGAQLLDLITNILDLNRIEAGKLRLDTAMVDFVPVAKDVLDRYQDHAIRKGLTVETSIPADLPPLYGDATRIRQVLDHLMDNAVKFTLTGGIRLEARTATVTRGIVSESSPEKFTLPTIGWLRDGRWLIFNVTDTGIGISPENQAKIFEEFARIDETRTREYAGTGLGLAIAKRLVTLHDGAIWVKSRVDEGSTFFVALPVDVKPTAGDTGTTAPVGTGANVVQVSA